jgi:transcriptional regulator with XRE-family HTH domain
MAETFGQALRRLREEAGMSQPQLARLAHISQSSLSRYESDLQGVSSRMAARLDSLVRAGGELSALLSPVEPDAETLQNVTEGQAAAAVPRQFGSVHSDELAALELARRVAASDVGSETLSLLENIFDDLAAAYPVTPPLELLSRLREQLAYVASLMDTRKTVAEYQRLLVVGGWLSLLAATVHIDLDQQAAASACLRTAASLAQHANNDEIRAWCFETEAWRVLTEGDYRMALELSQAAQRLAPAGSSVAIQATAQEGRAWARLGHAQETNNAIERVHRLVAPLSRPQRAEHHYRYDPDKSVVYTATTLAWIGDPAAEGFARHVIARLKSNGDERKWPRRTALANLDLALTLLVTDRLDEACHATHQAVASGCIVPSNYWRAVEVVSAVETRGVSEAKDLREAYEAMRRA